MAKRQQAKKMAAAGKSAAQIQNRTGVSAKAAQKFTSRSAPTAAANNSMKIAQDVIANPGKYDQGYTREAYAANPDSVIGRGLYGGGLSDSEGGMYKLQGFQVPGATTGIGPNSDVLFAAGPNANQEWLNANFGPGGRYYGGDRQASGGTGGTGGDSGGGGSSSEPAAPAQDLTKIRGLGQGLRIAGTDGISRGELDTLMETTGKSGGKIIQRLDQLNKKLKGNEQNRIRLNSGAANKLIKEESKKGLGFMPTDFGQGKIGQNIQSRLGVKEFPGTMNQGQRRGGVEGKDPDLMMGGTQIRGGGREIVRGMGKQYKGPSGTPDTTPGGDTGGGDMGDGGDMGTGIDSPINETIEETNKGMSSGAGGLDLASWATGFKKAQSARQRAGRRAQGLASQKKTPFSSWKN
jgi:hypothetical protein